MIKRLQIVLCLYGHKHNRLDSKSCHLFWYTLTEIDIVRQNGVDHGKQFSGPMSIKWTEKSGELSNEKFSSNGSKTIVMRVWTERVVETMDVSEQSILQFR